MDKTSGKITLPWKLGINRLKLAEYEDNIARKQSPDLIDLIAVIFSLMTI